MPTIEIISFERKSPIKIQREKYNFAIRQNSKLLSHRGLFQELLNDNKGVIFHIGNLDLEKECFFFASELIDWGFEDVEISIPVFEENIPAEEQWSGSGQARRFKFEIHYVGGINNLLHKSVMLSPIKKACILSDFQMGPKFAQIIQLKDIREFWDLHNDKGLAWNTMYIIQG